MSIWTDIRSDHYRRHSIIICKVGLGKRGTWITFRGTGDRLSSNFQLVGAVEDRVVKVNSWVPRIVAEHLQSSLKAAIKSYTDFENGVSPDPLYTEEYGLDVWRISMLDSGPLRFLPETHCKVFQLNETVGNFVPRTVYHDWFVAQTNKELKKLFAEEKAAAS